MGSPVQIVLESDIRSPTHSQIEFQQVVSRDSPAHVFIMCRALASVIVNAPTLEQRPYMNVANTYVACPWILQRCARRAKKRL